MIRGFRRTKLSRIDIRDIVNVLGVLESMESEDIAKLPKDKVEEIMSFLSSDVISEYRQYLTELYSQKGKCTTAQLKELEDSIEKFYPAMQKKFEQFVLSLKGLRFLYEKDINDFVMTRYFYFNDDILQEFLALNDDETHIELLKKNPVLKQTINSISEIKALESGIIKLKDLSDDTLIDNDYFERIIDALKVRIKRAYASKLINAKNEAERQAIKEERDNALDDAYAKFEEIRNEIIKNNTETV